MSKRKFATMFNLKNFNENVNWRIGNPFCLKAFAETVEPPVSNAASSTTLETPRVTSINYEDLIQRARKEEKEKLYPKIEKLQNDINALTERYNAVLIERETLQREVDGLKAKEESADSEKVSKLNEKLTALETELAELKSKPIPDEEALRAQLEKEYKIKLYREVKLAENDGKIASIFEDKILGETEEEIDAAISEAISNTDKLREELGGTPKAEETPEEEPSTVEQPPKKSRRVVNPSAPSSRSAQDEALRELTELSSGPLTPDKMKRYQELREVLKVR